MAFLRVTRSHQGRQPRRRPQGVRIKDHACALGSLKNRMTSAVEVGDSGAVIRLAGMSVAVSTRLGPLFDTHTGVRT